MNMKGLINGRNQIPLLGISSSIPFWSESVPNIGQNLKLIVVALEPICVPTMGFFENFTVLVL